MLAGLLNSGIQSITNEGCSLNQDQSPYHAVIDIDRANGRSESRKVRRIKWSLLLGSFTLEGLSIAFEQLSAPKKPIYAFMSMIMASLGLLISIIELSFRLQENNMIISPLLGDALENFGFFGSTWQFIYAVVQYVFLYKKKIHNPIKISVLTLIFLICATISRLYNIYRGDSSTQQLVRGEIQLTSSGVEASVSLSNATAIEETEPVKQDDNGVLITTKKLRDDTTVHRRVRTRAIEETEPVVQDDPGVEDTAVHRRVRTSQLHAGNEELLFSKPLSVTDVKQRIAVPPDWLIKFPFLFKAGRWNTFSSYEEFLSKMLSQTDVHQRLARPAALSRKFPFPVAAHRKNNFSSHRHRMNNFSTL